MKINVTFINTDVQYVVFDCSFRCSSVYYIERQNKEVLFQREREVKLSNLSSQLQTGTWGNTYSHLAFAVL